VIERVYDKDSVMGAAEEKEPPTATTTIETITTTTTDPWMLFLYALKAPATKDKYIQRLIRFLDFLGYQGTKEEKARAFAAQAKADHVYAFNSVLKFFQSKREQIVLIDVYKPTGAVFIDNLQAEIDDAGLYSYIYRPSMSSNVSKMLAGEYTATATYNNQLATIKFNIISSRT
jgi:hypothetical protein